MTWYEDKKKQSKELTKSTWEIMGDRADSDLCIYCGHPKHLNPSPEAYDCNGCYKTRQLTIEPIRKMWAERLSEFKPADWKN